MKNLSFNRPSFSEESQYRLYIKNRDELGILEMTGVETALYDPTDEQIEWLNKQLLRYCSRIKPSLLFSHSKAGKSFYQVARHHLSFGCVYQILVGDLRPGELFIPIRSSIALAIFSAKAGNEKLIKTVVDSKNKDSKLAAAAHSEIALGLVKVFESKELQLFEIKLQDWLSRIS